MCDFEYFLHRKQIIDDTENIRVPIECKQIECIMGQLKDEQKQGELSRLASEIFKEELWEGVEQSKTEHGKSQLEEEHKKQCDSNLLVEEVSPSKILLIVSQWKQSSKLIKRFVHEVKLDPERK